MTLDPIQFEIEQGDQGRREEREEAYRRFVPAEYLKRREPDTYDRVKARFAWDQCAGRLEVRDRETGEVRRFFDSCDGHVMAGVWMVERIGGLQ